MQRSRADRSTTQNGATRSSYCYKRLAEQTRKTAARSACVVAFSPCPYKGSIRRHEPREHRRDEFRRLDLLSVLTRENLGVGDEVTIYGSRQLDGELDRPIILNGREPPDISAPAFESGSPARRL